MHYKIIYLHLYHQTETKYKIMKNEKLIVCIQCTDESGNIGTFVREYNSRKQLTKTYNSCFELFESAEYNELKKYNKFV